MGLWCQFPVSALDQIREHCGFSQQPNPNPPPKVSVEPLIIVGYMRQGGSIILNTHATISAAEVCTLQTQKIANGSSGSLRSSCFEYVYSHPHCFTLLDKHIVPFFHGSSYGIISDHARSTDKPYSVTIRIIYVCSVDGWPIWSGSPVRDKTAQTSASCNTARTDERKLLLLRTRVETQNAIWTRVMKQISI